MSAKGARLKCLSLSTLRHNSGRIRVRAKRPSSAQSVVIDLKTADEAPFPGDIAHQNDPTSGLLTFVTQLSF